MENKSDNFNQNILFEDSLFDDFRNKISPITLKSNLDSLESSSFDKIDLFPINIYEIDDLNRNLKFENKISKLFEVKFQEWKKGIFARDHLRIASEHIIPFKIQLLVIQNQPN